MGLWLTFLALSFGAAIIIALAALHRSRTEHVTIHDRAPPMGRPRRPSDRASRSFLRRAR